MGYTHDFKITAEPNSAPLWEELRTVIGYALDSGASCKWPKPWFFFKHDDVLDEEWSRHRQMIELSKKYHAEIRVWAVGEDCWDSHSGRLDRGDIYLFIFKDGEYQEFQ